MLAHIKKKTERRLFNLHYIEMAGIALLNLFIKISDPRQPRRTPEVGDPDLI